MTEQQGPPIRHSHASLRMERAAATHAALPGATSARRPSASRRRADRRFAFILSTCALIGAALGVASGHPASALVAGPVAAGLGLPFALAWSDERQA